MTDTGHHLARAADIHPLHWQLLIMVTHNSQEPVRVEVSSSDVTILTPSDDNIVSDTDHCVDTIRVSWPLVAVQTVLVLAATE